MPYARSRARKCFEREAQVCLGTIRLAEAIASAPERVKEYVLCAALIRCSAHLEFYLRSIIADWIEALNSREVNTEFLPGPLRVRHFMTDAYLSAHKRYVAFDDEREFYQSIGDLFQRREMQFVINGVQCPPLSSDCVCQGKTFPSPKNLKALFARVGIANVFADLNRLARTDLKLILQSFSDARSSWAHDGLPVGLNARDVRDKIESAAIIVRHLDRIMYRHIVQVGGAADWRR